MNVVSRTYSAVTSLERQYIMEKSFMISNALFQRPQTTASTYNFSRVMQIQRNHQTASCFALPGSYKSTHCDANIPKRTNEVSYCPSSLQKVTRRYKYHCAAAVQSNWQEDKQYPSVSTAQNKQKRKSSSVSQKLQPPEIIYSNNHLLVVNKTPGWKSQPGEGSGPTNILDPKCLLTNLQRKALGGGSQQNFLIPTHRLDQPCSGVLIFAKNGKAASRVQVAWAKRQVEKCYWVVVEGGKAGRGGKMNGLELLQSRSSKLSNGSFRLSAVIQSGKSKSRGKSSSSGGSVVVKPVPLTTREGKNKDTDGRVCHIDWKHLIRLPDTTYSTTRHLLSVKTDTGAKHQVRALLAIAGGAPIAGDLRYGNNVSSMNQDGGRVHQPLSDQSVALHSRSVFLPTVSLGGMEFLKDEPFVADIPSSWSDLFGICENDVRHF